MIKWILVGVAALLAFAVLMPSDSDEPAKRQTEVQVTEKASDLWRTYSPTVKKRIDRLAENKNCNGLQKEFDVAYEGKNENKVLLMDYVNDKMEGAGCFE